MAKKRKRSEKEKARSRERAREHYEKKKADPEQYAKMLEYNRRWKDANPEKEAEYQRRYQAKRSPEERRATWVKSKYRLTDEQYQEILEHDGRCDACGDALDEGHRTHIDHDHKTGRFRGILCGHCNQAAGYVRDNPEKAERLARYLRRVQALT